LGCTITDNTVNGRTVADFQAEELVMDTVRTCLVEAQPRQLKERELALHAAEESDRLVLKAARQADKAWSLNESDPELPPTESGLWTSHGGR
jgi:hypothetical protein